MTFTIEDAETQRAAFEAAAETMVVRGDRYTLRRRAREWKRAARDLEDADGQDAVIDLAGTVTPGMRVWCPTPEGDDWLPVERVLARDGVTLHLRRDDPYKKDPYLAMAGTTSPVVVRS